MYKSWGIKFPLFLEKRAGDIIYRELGFEKKKLVKRGVFFSRVKVLKCFSDLQKKNRVNNYAATSSNVTQTSVF